MKTLRMKLKNGNEIFLECDNFEVRTDPWRESGRNAVIYCLYDKSGLRRSEGVLEDIVALSWREE